MPGKAYIGTSGWNYKEWKDTFYKGIPQKEWLRFCAERFTAVEVNATFYRQQKRSTFEKWHDQTPPGFHFAIKGNRYLTHNKKLKDAEEPIDRERESASALEEKLSAVLWQLPGNFSKNFERLTAFAGALSRWREVRHALEFRHPSWFDDEVAGCLQEHGLAVCLSDAADWPMWDRVTTDLVYIRLHGHTRTYASSYSTQHLRSWAERILEWLNLDYDAHVYFDNTGEGAAALNALQLLDMVGEGKGG